MEERVPAVVIFAIALLLIATPVYLFPHAGQPEYSHSIEQVPESEVPEDANILQYSDLSKEAKAAIKDARTGDGLVYGKANKPPEFFYSDYAYLNQGIYYIHQNEQYYQLTTYAGGGLFSVNLFLQWCLVVLGFTTGLIGYVSLQSQDWTLSAVFSTYGALLLVGALLQPETKPLGLVNFHLLLLALFGVVTSLVAFGAIVRRHSVLQATEVVVIPLVVVSVLWILQLLPIADMPALPVGTAGLVILTIIPVFTAIGYGGQLMYSRLTQ